MRIVCPICSAAYEVRDALLIPGRTVRCARCSEQWVAVPLSPAASQASLDEPPATLRDDPSGAALLQQSQAALPRMTAMDRLATQPAPLPTRDPRLRAAWAASIVVLLLFGWGAIAWRADLMHAWPPSTRLYDAIGLTAARSPGR